MGPGCRWRSSSGGGTRRDTDARRRTRRTGRTCRTSSASRWPTWPAQAEDPAGRARRGGGGLPARRWRSGRPTADPEGWGKTQLNLGRALRRPGHAVRRRRQARRFCAEAVAAYRAALGGAYARIDSGGWAMTQDYLGMRSAPGARRTEGPAGIALLAEAVAAHRAALEVYGRGGAPGGRGVHAVQSRQCAVGAGRADRGGAGSRCLPRRWRPIVRRWRCGRGQPPVDWAMTQNNSAARSPTRRRGPAGRRRGAARRGGGGLPGGAGGADARGAHPVDWAMAQNNLGLALADQAARTEGEAAEALLATRWPPSGGAGGAYQGGATRSSGQRRRTASARALPPAARSERGRVGAAGGSGGGLSRGARGRDAARRIR